MNILFQKANNLFVLVFIIYYLLIISILICWDELLWIGGFLLNMSQNHYN